MRIVPFAAWRVVFPPTYALLRAAAWLATRIRREHPLTPVLLLAWLPIRAFGILGYWTCVEIEVALR